MSSCSIASIDSASKNGTDGEGVKVRLLTVKKSTKQFNSALWFRIKDDQNYSKAVDENKYDNPEKEILNVTSAYINKRKSPNIEHRYKFKDKKTGAISYGNELPTGRVSPTIDFKEKLLENNYPIKDNSDYWVPIGLGQSVAASKSVSDCDVSLMPVFPVSFMEPTGTKLQHLRNGYIYIFMNGFLWREIFVVSLIRYPGAQAAEIQQAGLRDWSFYDINLTHNQGDDIRNVSLSTQSQKAVIVFPRKVGSEKPKFEVCFSERQWSWDYICRMGGMDKDNDPRYIEDYYKNKLHDNVVVDETLRKNRLQEIDLNAYSNSSKTQEDVRQRYLMPIQQAAQENNESDEVLEDKAVRIRLHHLLKTGGHSSDKEYVDSELPALILLDPLRVAWQLREKYMAKYYYVADWHQKNNEDKSAGDGASLLKEVTIARYVSAILKGNEQLNIDKKLVRPGYDGVIQYYDETNEKLNQDCENAAEALTDYLYKESEEPSDDYINSVNAALCDFEIDFIKQDETKAATAAGAMEYWTDLLDQIDDTEAMQGFLENELETENSISNRVLGVIHTASLQQQVNKDLEYAKNKITIKYNTLKGRAAVQQNIKDSYNISTTVHGLLGNFVNIFSRVFNGKLKKALSATNKLDSDSAKQIIKTMGQVRLTGQMNMDKMFATLSRIYNKPITIEAISYKDLKLAILANQKLNKAGTILAITPRSGFPQSNIVQIHIDGQPVAALDKVKDFGKKYVLDMGTNIILFMQVMSTAMAWQQLVSKGITSKQDVIKLFDTSFKTINLAATGLKLFLEHSARKELELLQNQKTLTNLFYGKIGTKRIAVELLGTVASLASIGSSIMGMMADLEKADDAMIAGEERLADEHLLSAQLNKFSAIGSSLILVSSVGIGLLGITTGIAGMILAFIPVVGWLIAIVVLIASFKTAQNIANLTLTPIEKWLKHCYWGTEPYKTLDISKEKLLVTDYSTLKNNLKKELEVITEYLYSFSVRTVWTHENKVNDFGRGIVINHKKSLVIDVSLTNYVDDARLYLEVTSKGLDGVTQNSNLANILYSDYITLSDNGNATGNRSKENAFNTPTATIKHFDYIPTLPSNEVSKPSNNLVKSKTIRFVFDEKYIDDKTQQISARIVLDPFRSGEPLIPNFDGVYLLLTKKDEVVGQVQRASSIKEYRRSQELDHNSNKFLEYLYSENNKDI